MDNMATEKCILDPEKFALNASECIKEKNVEKIINIVKELNEYYDNPLVVHQKFSEHCLKDILQILKNEAENWTLSYLMWSLLNVISSSSVVRKMLWKDQNIVLSLFKSLKHAIENKNFKLQKVTTGFLSTMLIGANNIFFQAVAEQDFIPLLLDIIEGDHFIEETFKSVICCFGLLCDGTDSCKQKLMELKVADAVLKMGEKHALHDEDFCNLAALTYDDLSALQMSHSIGRKKFLRMQVDDTVFCSNPSCLKKQGDVKFKKCSRCKITFYCSKECQVFHWKHGGHHTLCSRILDSG